MRLISWNMAAASPRISKSKYMGAWEYVLSLKPDLALLQEAIIPDWIYEVYNVKWLEAYKGKNWGSAVLSKFPLQEYDIYALEPALEPILRSLRGQIVGAQVKLPNGDPLTLISVHAPAKTLSKKNIPNEMLDIIKLKLNNYVWRADVAYGAVRNLPKFSKNFIFGGDWNLSRLFDVIYWPRGNQEFFDRMSAAGIIECFRIFRNHEIQTWYRKGDAPYQLDHLFCDPRTANKILSCDVDRTPVVDKLSDHSSLIVEIDL